MKLGSYLTVVLISFFVATAYAALPKPDYSEPAYPKLETALSNFLDIYNSQGRSAAQKYAGIHNISLSDDRVLIELTLRHGHLPDEISDAELKQLNIEVECRSRHFLTLWIPVDRLAAFSERFDIVSRVHRPHKPVADVTTEGFALVGGDEFHDENITGEGVSIAILDMGFGDYEDAQDAGELPDELTIRNYTDEDIGEGNIHGSACAEVIADFVPDAEFYLVKIFHSGHYENAIDYLIDEEVDVISMSLGWLAARGDYFEGGDPMSELANDAYQSGILFVSSAGNAAKAHYRAEFDDDDEDDNYHRFANGVIINHFGNSADHFTNIRQGELISVSLQWDDFPESDEDYNLYLLFQNEENDEWEVVDASENEQNGNDPPYESIDYQAEQSGHYGVAVHNHDGEDGIDFTLFALHDLAYRTPEGSVTIPALAEHCLAVAAVNHRHWNRENVQPEGFSSRGPTYDDRIKPEISGCDGVISFVYDGDFYGTSAACPHVAGAAALVLSSDQEMNNRDLWSYLTNAARDVGEDGQDNLFGYGLLYIDPDFEVEWPRIRVEPGFLEFFFDDDEVEQSADLTISNIGNQTLIFETEVEIIFEPDDAHDWISWEPGDGEVEPDEEMDIVVTVNISESGEGEYLAELHILSNDQNDSDVCIQVIMLVTPFPDIWVDWHEEYGYPDLMDWNRVYDAMEINQSYDLGFTVYSRGRSELFVENIIVNSEFFTVDAGGFELPRGERRDVTVTFRTDEVGDYEPSIFVVSNDIDVWEWEIPLHAEIPNNPPRVVGWIEDQEIDEDFEAYVVVDLDDIFDDPDGHQLIYSAEIDDEIVAVEIDDSNRFHLEAVENLHGMAKIAVIADDRNGGTASDTFQVTVNPVNDPPTTFHLVSPEDYSTVYDYPNVVFKWENSLDEVEDSTVTYALMLEYNDEEHQYTDLNDTSFTVSRQELSTDPDLPTEISWYVLASDGTETIRSAGDDFHVIVAPLSVDDEDNLLPTELTLGPIYPNPFNDMVTIGFALPQATEATLTIFDPLGRRVRTLTNSHLSPGRYRTYWDGYNQAGAKVSSGVYICRMSTGNDVLMQRIVLLR